MKRTKARTERCGPFFCTKGSRVNLNQANQQPHTSDVMKRGVSRAPARAMLLATGLTHADLEKPLVAVVHSWSDVSPCNFNLREIAEQVKAGVREAGGTPIEFNTIVVTDGISMGTEGMKGSLVSREVIAD